MTAARRDRSPPKKRRAFLPPERQFASDNYSGICPEVEAAILEANRGHTPSYGRDPWTRRAEKMLQEVFDTDCAVHFVFNGTAANSLAIGSLSDTFHSVLCHETAHVESDECGAPAFFSHGTRLLPIPGLNGKLDPRVVETVATRRDDVHHPKPGVLSLTQSTELGTVYTVREIKGLCRVARKHGMHTHMDGARFANALAALKVRPADLTWKAGLDVLCLGGTKNGMAFGEAVIFFNRELAQHFEFRRKQGGQLASKMRFLSAQWLGLLRDDVWLRNAAHANSMAQLLEKRVSSIRSLKLAYPRQANAVFVKLPDRAVQRLHKKGWHFYTDVAPHGEARLMCSWDTRLEDVETFVDDLRGVL
jgi:threonine aldolase